MKLTSPGGLFAVFLLAGALIAGIWFAYTSPQMEQLNAATAERDANIEKIEESQGYIDAIGDGSSGVNYMGDLYQDVQTADALIPQGVDPADAAQTYTALASGYGLKTLFNEAETGSTATAKAFSMTVTGSYEDISSFISSLENQTPLVTVTTLALDGGTENPETGAVEYNAQITLKLHAAPTAPLVAAPSQ